MFYEQGGQESLLVTSKEIARARDRSRRISIKDFFERNKKYLESKEQRNL